MIAEFTDLCPYAYALTDEEYQEAAAPTTPGRGRARSSLTAS